MRFKRKVMKDEKSERSRERERERAKFVQWRREKAVPSCSHFFLFGTKVRERERVIERMQ